MILVRHGATETNLSGLRCGGDLDVPLTDLGRHQVAEAAQRIIDLDRPVRLIIASHLQRTLESAEILSRMLGGIEVLVEPSFAERRLGAWNLRAVADTEAALAAGMTPPGGESNTEFLDRIELAARRIVQQHIERRPLLVGSKGVARAFRDLLGMPRAKGLSNGELLQLDLAVLSGRNTIGCHA